jgi:hypothetical protein
LQRFKVPASGCNAHLKPYTLWAKTNGDAQFSTHAWKSIKVGQLVKRCSGRKDESDLHYNRLLLQNYVTLCSALHMYIRVRDERLTGFFSEIVVLTLD